MWVLPLCRRKRAWIQGARREDDEGILDNMSIKPNIHGALRATPHARLRRRVKPFKMPEPSSFPSPRNAADYFPFKDRNQGDAASGDSRKYIRFRRSSLWHKGNPTSYPDYFRNSQDAS